jgi:hypothetical protein
MYSRARSQVNFESGSSVKVDADVPNAAMPVPCTIDRHTGQACLSLAGVEQYAPSSRLAWYNSHKVKANINGWCREMVDEPSQVAASSPALLGRLYWSLLRKRAQALTLVTGTRPRMHPTSANFLTCTSHRQDAILVCRSLHHLRRL